MGTTRRLCTMVIRVYWPYGMAIRHGHEEHQNKIIYKENDLLLKMFKYNQLSIQ
jgi:hypothetical protein